MSLVTLVSGGLDSTVMAMLSMKDEVKQHPLFVDYGHLAAETEWETVLAVFASLGLPEPLRMAIRGFGRLLPSGLTDPLRSIVEDAFLPGRNLMLLTAGCAYAYSMNAGGVAIGLLNESTALFPDQTNDFLERAQEAVDAALGVHIEIVAPLQSESKMEVILLAERLNVANTYSCHAGHTTPCGECVSCIELSRAVQRIAEG